MSSVLARYEVSGERRKPKPSGNTSSVPSPKMDSPFFACAFSMAKIRSCLRRRLAFSMPAATARSTSCVTCNCFISERCMEALDGVLGVSAAAGVVGSGRWDVRTSGGCAAWGLLMLGVCAWTSALDNLVWDQQPHPNGWVPDWRQTVRGSDVAVKKGRQLRFGQRAHARRLDVAV